MRRRGFMGGSAALAAGGLTHAAWAQDRRRTLLSVTESGPNALDFHTVGANRSVYAVVWNCYDRLIGFKVKRDANGNGVYDYSSPQPELAEDMDIGPASATLRLRRDAVFADGTKVTARDVKYTFDRAVGVGGYPASTMATASLTSPEQFVVVDDYTFRIDYTDQNKLAPLYLSAPVVGIYHSQLVQQHATAQDKWGQAFTRNAVAGSGAFRVERYTSGQELVLARNPDWRCGLTPALDRVIWRVVPSASTRRALLERGDADLIWDVPPKDAEELGKNQALRVWGLPMENTVTYLGLNTRMAPFDNVKVRQAIAWAVPYRKIMQAALYGRGRMLAGGPARITTPDWPQPTQYDTDIPRAKALLAEAGFPQGFESKLYFDISQADTHEPIAELVQESLRDIGIRISLEKVAGSEWRTLFSGKQLPMQINLFGCWFDFSDFFFYFVYHSRNAIFNTMSYSNPEVDKLVEEARLTHDAATHDRDAIGYIQKVYDDVPNVPLFQPNLDIATRREVSGLTYWFFREADYRFMRKA